MLRGRLGLDTARVPHVDRQGLLWLSRGKLFVVDGTLHFATKGSPYMQEGNYSIPFQGISTILLGPGCTVSHDSLRLLARHGTGLVAVGEDGVRFYASMPFGSDDSRLARLQAKAWSDVGGQRLRIVRRMYAWRLGEVVPNADITVLRGIEGARAKNMYEQIARQHGINWQGRRYNRNAPTKADLPNQAINHAATAVQGAAMIAVAATSTLPQLGFIHEDSSISFCLDIADLYRDEIVLPVAFSGVNQLNKDPNLRLESIVRRLAGKEMQKQKVISSMIKRIRSLFEQEKIDKEPLG